MSKIVHHHSSLPIGMKRSIPRSVEKTIEETYTKKTQHEHILLRPDTYIGSIEKQSQMMWTVDSETEEIVHKMSSYIPGLLKIFDEILVNAADNKQRDPTMSRIQVTIDSQQGSICIWNNGDGIPIVVHKEHGMYIPELIFGHLMTGSNFDDDESKTTGGRNGYGAKLANIFSRKFVVETADNVRNLKYKQTYLNNMTARSDPEITEYSGADYTSVTFYPDLKRFKMNCLDRDIIDLFSKRVYDIAATISARGKKLSVYLNGNQLQDLSFEKYVNRFSGIENVTAFQQANDRWAIAVSVSDGSFQQVSFVNSIATIKGGTHVNYITDQITSRLLAIVKKRNKGHEIKASQIRNHLVVFVNAIIENPAFDSQNKENLITKHAAFGSTCIVSDRFIKDIETSSIVENILSWAKFKQNNELKKKGGSKRSKITGITKLDDANFAGTSRSSECTLILTEGDSAKALAVSGLGVVGRDFYGVFPLKGKLLNVREAHHAQIIKSEEIQNITKILGLTFQKEYGDASALRYGHLMIMTDQDYDGSHIKGLLINFLHHFWPSLLHIDGFLKQFITPIVKCTKGVQEYSFFTIPQYNEWKINNAEGKGWKAKYYKGLGTSTSAEARNYFSDLKTHEIDFAWDDKADDMIDMAFGKKRVTDRKRWLLAMEPGIHIDYNVDSITYDNFINEELILYSNADNERSLPHFMDGLKPSHRKVLFACFKRNLKQEVKVAQLAGYISENSAYHHGEASLTQTIIGMAQDYVGSNNINLLTPCGQFGTRLMGGKDAASPRYVFTKLESIARYIFHPDDDPLLNFLEDEGQSIEPVYYVPIIPMVLVNGSDGIGTGWSTSVPQYNPREIIANLRLMIAGEIPNIMHPWHRGFKGKIVQKSGNDTRSYTVSGNYEEVSDRTIEINELPIGRWTTDYKQVLETLTVTRPDETSGITMKAIVKDFKENHTDTSVLFTVTFLEGELEKLKKESGGLQKKLKLDSSITTTNMMMFNSQSIIQKYLSPQNIMDDFYDVRLAYYNKRKEHQLETFTLRWEILDNKVRFLENVITGDIVITNRKKNDLLTELQDLGFKAFKNENIDLDSNDDENKVKEIKSNLGRDYDYLLSMKIWNLTVEKLNTLIAERNDEKKKLILLRSKPAKLIWIEDLDALEGAIDLLESNFDRIQKQNAVVSKPVKKLKSPIRGNKRRQDHRIELDDYSSNDGDSDFSDYEPQKKRRSRAAANTTTTVAILKDVRPVVTPRAQSKKKIVIADKSSDIGPIVAISRANSKSFNLDYSSPSNETLYQGAPSRTEITLKRYSNGKTTSPASSNLPTLKAEDEDLFTDISLNTSIMQNVSSITNIKNERVVSKTSVPTIRTRMRS